MLAISGRDRATCCRSGGRRIAPSTAASQPIPSQAEAVEILERGTQQIRDLLDDIPEPLLTQPRTIGGGDWSAKDLVAHLTFWERNAVEALTAWSAGGVPPVDRMLQVPGLEAINLAAVEATQSLSWGDVHSLSLSTHDELVAQIQDTSEQRWLSPPTSRGIRTLGERLGSILVGRGDDTFGHVAAHLDDAESFAAGMTNAGQ